jgi:hypothetical protein
MEQLFVYALAAFFIAVFIGVFLYFRPHTLTEGFATVALEGETMPTGLLRDAEAQALLARFQGLKVVAPNSETGQAYDEFKLILQKVLCIDADITGAGAGTFTTYRLPFSTHHDIEPAASLVNRCIRQAVQPRDIEIAMDKFESRGNELIDVLCFDDASKQEARVQFHGILLRVARNITATCLKPKASMDIPAGPRDPGYYVPHDVETLRPYAISGGEPEYLQ